MTSSTHRRGLLPIRLLYPIGETSAKCGNKESNCFMAEMMDLAIRSIR